MEGHIAMNCYPGSERVTISELSSIVCSLQIADNVVQWGQVDRYSISAVPPLVSPTSGGPDENTQIFISTHTSSGQGLIPRGAG